MAGFGRPLDWYTGALGGDEDGLDLAQRVMTHHDAWTYK
jgi:hypothetical protein